MKSHISILSMIGWTLLWLALGCETGEFLESDAELQDRASSPTEYQAENATSKSGCSVATNKAGYTGSGFMDFGENGTWIEWNNVNAAAAGNHTLTFRYAVASASRQCAVLINGVNVGNLPFSSTGSWTTWKTVSITKALKAGNNTVRVLANTSSGGPNLDKMELLFNGVVATGTCALVNENGTANLSCPSGQLITGISFASYGTPTGSCPSFATSSCHASTSKSKVESACLNKSSCSVSANNAVFGDPCSGTPKKLAVVFSCGGGSSQAVITASGENLPNEGKDKAFDRRTDTKWLTHGDFGWIQYQFASGASKTVTSYSLSSANDKPERDPRDWRFMGSNDGSSWTTLDTRTGQSFSARFQKKTYPISNARAFRIYRLDISSNSNPVTASSTQLSEIEFHEGAVADNCPNDPNKVEPGECGCGIPEGTCDDDDTSVVTKGPLDKASGTKLRIASWNNFRGSIFPKTSTLWRAINTSGKYHVTRTEGAARILDAVEADIWMMQETVYSTSDLPAGVTKDSINNQIASYMGSVTGDTWKVSCNAEGLCTMVRNALKFDGHWEKGGRVAGDRVILPDGSKVLIVNVHYMNSGNATDTKSLIDSLASTVSAVFVAGDFNDGVGGTRYNIVDGISGMDNLSMVHFKDSNAKHLTSAMQNGQHKNTKGYMKWGDGPVGQDLVTSIGGGQIDHFFLKSSTWKAGNRFILNTLLFAPGTLDLYDLEPLDVALQPQYYLQYFKDFLNRGIIYEIPSSAYDASSGLDHDHLPMIVDFTW